MYRKHKIVLYILVAIANAPTQAGLTAQEKNQSAQCLAWLINQAGNLPNPLNACLASPATVPCPCSSDQCSTVTSANSASQTARGPEAAACQQSETMAQYCPDELLKIGITKLYLNSLAQGQIAYASMLSTAGAQVNTCEQASEGAIVPSNSSCQPVYATSAETSIWNTSPLAQGYPPNQCNLNNCQTVLSTIPAAQQQQFNCTCAPVNCASPAIVSTQPMCNGIIGQTTTALNQYYLTQFLWMTYLNLGLQGGDAIVAAFMPIINQQATMPIGTLIKTMGDAATFSTNQWQTIQDSIVANISFKSYVQYLLTHQRALQALIKQYSQSCATATTLCTSNSALPIALCSNQATGVDTNGNTVTHSFLFVPDACVNNINNNVMSIINSIQTNLTDQKNGYITQLSTTCQTAIQNAQLTSLKEKAAINQLTCPACLSLESQLNLLQKIYQIENTVLQVAGYYLMLKGVVATAKKIKLAAQATKVITGGTELEGAVSDVIDAPDFANELTGLQTVAENIGDIGSVSQAAGEAEEAADSFEAEVSRITSVLDTLEDFEEV